MNEIFISSCIGVSKALTDRIIVYNGVLDLDYIRSTADSMASTSGLFQMLWLEDEPSEEQVSLQGPLLIQESLSLYVSRVWEPWSWVLVGDILKFSQNKQFEARAD